MTIDSDNALPSMSILLVEDHDDSRLLMSRLLERLGHRIHSANSCQAALVAADQQQFDIMISDIGLPDGDGVELMRQLRARYGLRGIAISGYGAEVDMTRGRDAGFEHYLTKPIDFDQLEDVIRRTSRRV